MRPDEVPRAKAPRAMGVRAEIARVELPRSLGVQPRRPDEVHQHGQSSVAGVKRGFV